MRRPIPPNPSADAMARKMAARAGKRLRAARLKAGLSPQDVADLAGVSDETARRIERGDHSATLRTFVRLCRALGLPPRDVLGG